MTSFSAKKENPGSKKKKTKASEMFGDPPEGDLFHEPTEEKRKEMSEEEIEKFWDQIMCPYKRNEEDMKKKRMKDQQKSLYDTNKAFRKSKCVREPVKTQMGYGTSAQLLSEWNNTNNNVEGFHSGFKQLVGHDYLHFFKFLTKLQQNQAATELLIRQIDTGQNVIRPVSPTYQRINNTIRNLTAQYDLDGNGTNLINGIYHCLAQPLNIAF